MENIRIRDIVEAVNGRLLCGDMETSLRHISIDSRTMKGDDLFVPLIGEKADAHRFLSQAFENGAAASLTSEHDTCPEGITGALIRVEDTKKALQDIGRYIRSRLSLPLVGITGICDSSVVPVRTAPSSKWNSIPLFKNSGAVRYVPFSRTRTPPACDVSSISV